MTKTAQPPRVGIVPLNLTADKPIRSCWIDDNHLLVGHDPRHLPRELAVLLIRAQIGEFDDIDTNHGAGE